MTIHGEHPFRAADSDQVRRLRGRVGVDSDGRWTEGSPRGSVMLSTQPPGRYYLRVEPEGAPGTPVVLYSLTVRRDVPSLFYYAIAIVLLAIPPVLVSLRAAAFEGRRWQESDYGD